MNNDNNNIPPENERLRNLPAEELFRALYEEEKIAREFDADSSEGLSALRPGSAEGLVDQLNNRLKQDLRKKKKERKTLPGQSFMYITIITVLLLIITAYLIVRKMHGG